MHELSLASAIADIALRRGSERTVTVVHVRVGQLRQVVPDSLSFCWTMVTAGTALDGCQLELERVDAVVRCRSCGGLNPLGSQIGLLCPACASFDVEVVTGDEFLVTALDLAGVSADGV